MKRLLHKRITRKGFTLAELLIVVAILAILVAVSIPIFTSQLDKAKKSTDEANLRACKALVANSIITGEFQENQWGEMGTDAYSAKYDFEKGLLVPYDTSVKGYGQGSGITGATNDETSGNEYVAMSNMPCEKGSYLWVNYFPESEKYYIIWASF